MSATHAVGTYANESHFETKMPCLLQAGLQQRMIRRYTRVSGAISGYFDVLASSNGHSSVTTGTALQRKSSTHGKSPSELILREKESMCRVPTGWRIMVE